MAAHDFRQPGSLRQTAGRCVDYLGRLAEILGAYCSWRNHAERLYVLDSVVIESVNGAARDAKCLSGPDIDLFSVHCPGCHSFNTVDSFFIMIVAMGRSCQALCARNDELECRDAATGVLPGDQEANYKCSQADDLIGRIAAEIHGRGLHV